MDVLVQKEELQKKLEEKMEAERKQTETIEKLKQFIIKAGSDNDEEATYKVSWRIYTSTYIFDFFCDRDKFY